MRAADGVEFPVLSEPVVHVGRHLYGPFTLVEWLVVGFLAMVMIWPWFHLSQRRRQLERDNRHE